jgi:cholest-4-en-3-one 26-monooxygenase
MATTQVDEMDFLDPYSYGDGRAEDWLAQLRRTEPVWRFPDPDGSPGVWFVTKHADVVSVSRDPETFSSSRDNGGIDGLTESEKQQTVKALAGVGHMFIMMDPPQHGLNRRNLQPGFSSGIVGGYADRIRAIARRNLDAAMEKGEFDFIRDIAVEIPLTMVADLLRIPESDREWLFAKVEGTERPSSPEAYRDPERMKSMIDSIETVRSYGRDLITDRLKNPQGDDLGTLLAQSTVNGEPTPLEDQVSNFYMLWAAGAETTRTAIAWGMHAFLHNPDQYRLLREQPELLGGPAVEEILRWSSPVHQFRRNVMRDTEIRGVPIKAGEGVVIWYTSANRDEEVFENPYRFDITRRPNPHLVFGGGGPHFCMGAHLGRLEVRIVFEEIARRVADPQLLVEPTRFNSHRFRGLRDMRVAFS